MRITGVEVALSRNAGVEAHASIVLDDRIVVHGLRISNGAEGLVLSMPSRRSRDGGWAEVAFPTDGILRRRIEDLVFRKYQESLWRNDPPPAAAMALPVPRSRVDVSCDGESA